MVKAAITFGVACSVFVVVACLWAGAIIYKDINDMYDDIMRDMGQFRVSYLKQKKNFKFFFSRESPRTPGLIF